MARATRFLRMRAKPAAQKLQSILAIGLRQEYPPVWTVPLPPPLPRNEGKPTLVLDIDETLLHTYGMQAASADTVGFALFLRPHLREFLLEVMELYEIVFWTAGTASYCSAMLDALEVQVLQLPSSFYNVEEMRRDARGAPSSAHVNFFALSRTQTLEEHNYMKYLPMLGRPMHRVVMVDDNVRSFPLHPRNGIKVAPFLPNDSVLQEYSQAVSLLQQQGEEGDHYNLNPNAQRREEGGKEVDSALHDAVRRGKE
ncbi:putative PTP1-interacting protein, 39 kDa, partial [Trypanosoma grayi]|uniref:putative PTP1-interacting protein, 39 kDa n=1 Tax=Trypanosoma grayi TaxID=71804 RepID=UPI0004F417EA